MSRTPCSQQAPYLKFKWQQRDSASLAKWLSVRLRTKWLWVRISLLSLKLQIGARSFLTFRQTIQCRFTQKHCADKYSQYSSRRSFYSQKKWTYRYIWSQSWVTAEVDLGHLQHLRCSSLWQGLSVVSC